MWIAFLLIYLCIKYKAYTFCKRSWQIFIFRLHFIQYDLSAQFVVLAVSCWWDALVLFCFCLALWKGLGYATVFTPSAWCWAFSAARFFVVDSAFTCTFHATDMYNSIVLVMFFFFFSLASVERWTWRNNTERQLLISKLPGQTACACSPHFLKAFFLSCDVCTRLRSETAAEEQYMHWNIVCTVCCGCFPVVW